MLSFSYLFENFLDFDPKEIHYIFKEVIKIIKNKLGFNLSYMKLKFSNRPVNTNGTINYTMKPEQSSGSWTDNKIIYLTSTPQLSMNYYQKVETPSKEQINNHFRKVIAHELSHEIYRKVASKEFKEKIINTAKKEKFTTEYLPYVSKHKYDEELFCEYLAHQILK